MCHDISFGDFYGLSPYRPPQLIGRYDDLWQLALADPLTGPANRMRLLDRLNRELTLCQRHGGCVIDSHISQCNLKEVDELGCSSGKRNCMACCSLPRRRTWSRAAPSGAGRNAKRFGTSQPEAVDIESSRLVVGV